MPKVKKKDVPPHVVIPDTSVLWHGDKKLVVAPAFGRFWDKNSAEFHLQLVVPSVVKGELLFQQVGVADRATDKVGDLMTKISAISDHKYNHRIKPDVLKNRIESRFDKWLSGCNGAIEQVPVKRVNWNRLINDAIWRNPPFVEDKDEKDFEKGFRDSLILETTVEYCRHHTGSNVRFAFVCGDKLLREAVATRLDDDQRIAVYESFPDLESYLSLTKQKLTDEFIRNIQRRASAKFFTKGDDSCLGTREDLPGKMREQFKQYFEDPASAQSDPIDILSSIGLGSEKKWESLHSGMFWVGSTTFDEIKDSNIYHWETSVTFAQLFQRKETQYGGLGLAGVTEVTKQRVLVLPVTALWHARVTTDARFHDIELDGLKLGEKDFRAPTDEDKQSFRLPEESSNKAIDGD